MSTDSACASSRAGAPGLGRGRASSSRFEDEAPDDVAVGRGLCTKGSFPEGQFTCDPRSRGAFNGPFRIGVACANALVGAMGAFESSNADISISRLRGRHRMIAAQTIAINPIPPRTPPTIPGILRGESMPVYSRIFVEGRVVGEYRMDDSLDTFG